MSRLQHAIRAELGAALLNIGGTSVTTAQLDRIANRIAGAVLDAGYGPLASGHARCDGEHRAPKCDDPECWRSAADSDVMRAADGALAQLDRAAAAVANGAHIVMTETRALWQSLGLVDKAATEVYEARMARYGVNDDPKTSDVIAAHLRHAREISRVFGALCTQVATLADLTRALATGEVKP